MPKIEAKIEIKNVDEWSTNWDNPQDRKQALSELEHDLKIAMFERCGIDFNNIKIELDVRS
jgi:hypothetical protein